MRSRSEAPWTLMLLGALVCLGCGGGKGEPDGSVTQDAAWPDGALQLGVRSDGGSDFQVLPAEVSLVPGAQGGYHVEVRYQVSGEPTNAVLFTHRAHLTDTGALVSKGTRQFDVLPTGGAWLSEPFPIFMCPTPVGVTVTNQNVTIEVTATSADGGLLGTTSGTTKLRCGAGQYCETICKG